MSGLKWTISRKLLLALVVISLVILLMSALFGRLSFQRGFNAYLTARENAVVERLAEGLAREYQRNNSWESISANQRLWRQYLQSSGPGRPSRRADGRLLNRELGRPQRPDRGDALPPLRDRPRPEGSRRLRPDTPLFLGERLGLFTPNGNYIAGRNFSAGRKRADYLVTPVFDNDNKIAELWLQPAPAPSSELDIAFDEEQRRSLSWFAIVMLLFSAIVSWILAKQLTKPIRKVAEATRKLANGEYDHPVAISSNDELGELANDVNSLGRVLAANREARRRWLGDINHELRTPITILNAELQSLEDGFRPFNAASISSLQSEVNQLAQLVDDLYSLSSSDEGQLEFKFTEFDFGELLKERLNSLATRLADKGLELKLDLANKPLVLTADATRIGQLATNLIENSIRYTDAPGTIHISCTEDDDRIHFSIEDSKPSVPEDLHDKIFERLYRIDSSRNRRDGGSGLGLSICTAIVDAHKGTIKATNSALEGLRIDVTLPKTLTE